MSSPGLLIQCSVYEGHVKGGLQESLVKALQGNQYLPTFNAKTYYLYTQSPYATEATPAALTQFMIATAATQFAMIDWNNSRIGEWDPVSQTISFIGTSGLTPSAQVGNTPFAPFLGFGSDGQWEIFASLVSQYPEAFGSAAVIQYAVQICQVQIPAGYPFTIGATYGGPPIGFVPIGIVHPDQKAVTPVVSGYFNATTAYMIPVPQLTYNPVTGGGNLCALCGIVPGQPLIINPPGAGTLSVTAADITQGAGW